MTRALWRPRLLLFPTLLALATGSCATVRVGGPGNETGGDSIVGLPGGPVGSTPRPGAGTSAPQPGMAAAGMETRQICRSDPRPSGWIAVDYVDGGARCPKSTASAKERATSGAVIARYSNQPVGALMEVCANQQTPRGWQWASSAVQDAERCPGAAGDGRPTVRMMRRVR